MATNNSKNITATADQLASDIKALVLLSDSQQQLRRIIEDKILTSHDDDISRFIAIVRARRKSTRLGYFLMALGELVFAAFLVIAGLATVSPSLLGLSSPTALTDYYGAIITGFSKSALSPGLAFVNFLLAIVLLIAGFYSLRAASSDLRETGILSGPQRRL